MSHCTTTRATVLVGALHVFKWRPLLIAYAVGLQPNRAHCHCEADEVVINWGCWERGTPSVPVNAPNSPNGRQFVYIDPEVRTKQFPIADTSLTDPHYAPRLDPVDKCHPEFMQSVSREHMRKIK